MPRKRRHWTPGAGAHIISRFIDRRFHLMDDGDRRTLFDAIGRAHQRWDWRWLSWAAMSSHTHFGLLAGRIEPERFLRSAHTAFAQRFHRSRSGQTLGAVFASRPALHVVEQRDLVRMVAYHHRNPIRAGLVDRASHSTWTSHRTYLRLDPAPVWFDVERALAALGFSDTVSGRREFDDFVMGVQLDERPAPERQRDTPVVSVPSHRPIDWTRLISAACAVTGLDRPFSAREQRAARTRLLIAVVAIFDCGQTYPVTARALGMTTGGVFNLVARGRGTDSEARQAMELRQRMGLTVDDARSWPARTR